MTIDPFTYDEFLGGRITLKQPKKGYRVTSDSVYLASTIDVKNNEKVLDIGAGSGAILSCLVARIGNTVTNVKMHGIEIQQELLSLAIENAVTNKFDQTIKYSKGDIFDEVAECVPNTYHHVVSNPPYYTNKQNSASPYKTKSIAQGAATMDIKMWINRCLRMVRPKGIFTLVHRADQMGEVIKSLDQKVGDLIIYPLFSKKGKDANRVIICAKKDTKGPLALKSGLIVHKSDGNYTLEAENILRHARYLDITK